MKNDAIIRYDEAPGSLPPCPPRLSPEIEAEKLRELLLDIVDEKLAEIIVTALTEDATDEEIPSARAVWGLKEEVDQMSEYAEEAAASAAAAASSAEDAETAQSAAEDAAAAAASSATAADASADAAAGSATAAGNSASAAATSATQANSAKTAAQAAQAAAEAAVQDAEAAGAEQIELIEAAGASERESLSGYATRAETAAENAEASAESIQGSVSDAAEYATAAGESATAAAASATQAVAAKTAAETAKTAAEAAQAAAEAAQGEAEAAATAAETAQEAAEAAQTAAESAQSGAEDSATAAGGSATAAENSATAAAASEAAADASADAAEASATAADASADAAAASAEAAAESAATFETDPTLSIEGKAADAKAVGDAVNDLEDEITDLNSQIQQKANIDGYYESMTVGNAEQLVATVGVEDSAPYNFRTAGGSADIGDRLVDKLVGGTIAWNQMVKDGNFTDDVHTWAAEGISTVSIQDGVATVTASNNTPSVYNPALSFRNANSDIRFAKGIVGHTYLIDIVAKYPIRSRVYFGASKQWIEKYLEADQWENVQKIIKVTDASQMTSTGYLFAYLGCRDPNDLQAGAQISFKHIAVFDLTQMFGSTIADYIYSLEQATEGAGVAWFRHLFPKPYYAYNPGELMSVQAASHITRGFNAWDKENQPLYSGNFDTAGGSVNVCVDGYIRVVPGMQYELAHKNGTGVYQGQYLRFYDANKNLLSESTITSYSTNSITFTVPENAYYVRFMFYHGNGLTPAQIYALDVCLHLVWDGERDGEYEECVMHTYALDYDLELRGIPKLDSNNQLYYDGDTYESDGTVTRRYGVIDMGTIKWTADANRAGVFYGFIADKAIGSASNDKQGVACMKYSCRYGGVSTSDDKYVTDYPSYGGSSVFFRDTSFAGYTRAEVQAALSGINLVYLLATPTTETADPYQNPQVVDDFGTEEYVDYAYSQGNRDVAIPVGHETQYQLNLRAKVEMAPNSPNDNGDYILRHENGTNEYVPLVIPAELPENPSDNGTYVLKATVSNGTIVLSWEAET